jgi:HAD superfamily hydrolase (TIGR01509 family)
MFKSASFFITAVMLFSLGFEADAQSADQPQGDASSSSVPVSDASDGSVSPAAPVGTAPTAGEAPAVSSTSPALEVVPRSIVPATITPRSVPSEAVAPVVPTPRVVPPPPVSAAPKPVESVAPAVVESVATVTPQTTGMNNTLSLVAVGALALLGLVFALRTKGNKRKKNDPCGALKKRFEASQTAYDTMTGKLTLQELLIAQLEKEIANVKERAEEKVKEYAQDIANEIKDDILEKEKTGTLKEVVNLAEDAKAAYDDLSQKYEQAKALFDILRNRQKGLADEVREREAAFTLCAQGVTLAGGKTGSGSAIVIPKGSQDSKTILVDAVHTFTNDEGKIIEPIHKLLETYPNRKILLTDANDEQTKKRGLHNMPYEVFTLKHDPEKTDPRYYKTVLEHFGLNKDNVIYFEHNAAAVKSAQSLGITTYHYDNNKKDMEELKKFLDANLVI